MFMQKACSTNNPVGTFFAPRKYHYHGFTLPTTLYSETDCCFHCEVEVWKPCAMLQFPASKQNSPGFSAENYLLEQSLSALEQFSSSSLVLVQVCRCQRWCPGFSMVLVVVVVLHTTPFLGAGLDQVGIDRRISPRASSSPGVMCLRRGPWWDTRPVCVCGANGTQECRFAQTGCRADRFLWNMGVLG